MTIPSHAIERTGRWSLHLALACLVLSAGAGWPPSANASPPVHLAMRRSRPIQHVVFIVQENRSFNNLFMGFPGALTQDFGYDTAGAKIALHPVHLSTQWDIGHNANDFFAAYDGGKLDGWNLETACCGNIPPDFAYAYVPRREVAPYWQMARSYVLADEMFQSNLDGSFVAHQYDIAAFASRTVNLPNGAWGCPGGPQDTIPTLNEDRSYGPAIQACFDNPTIGDEADRAAVTWRFYTGAVYGDGGLWSAYQAIQHVYKGPDWKTNVLDPPSRFLEDIGSGQLANITWITPTLKNSDHGGLSSKSGPAWVTSLVNAVGQSTFWDSTAIFIMWDDWGGWFDPVAPVYEDYDGLGFRVPLIIISPYAKKGYVTHVQYETSSVLRFMESTFGLNQLNASDARANDPAADAFDFARPPRSFRPIAGAQPKGFWELQERASQRDPRPASLVGGD